MQNRPNNLTWLPAIKKVRLRNVGIFKDVTLELSEGMNIITGDAGTGKSTILQSLIGSVLNQLPIGYLAGKKNSEVYVEYRDYRIRHKPKIITRNDEKSVEMSAGEVSESNINYSLKHAQKGYSVLLDGGITGRLTYDRLQKVIDKLNKAPCQKIVVLHPTVIDKIKIKNAKVFRCVFDGSRGYSTIKETNI